MEKITSRFYWEGITNDNREYIRTCDVCQRTNDAKFVKCDAALHPINVQPKYGIRYKGIDLVGPLPKTDLDNRYIVTVMDY